MKTDSKWKYLLLGIGAFLVVIVLVYLRVAASFNIPLVSLLPLTPLTQSLPSVPPTPGVKPTSIQRLSASTGTVMYIVLGKFVTTPSYDAQNVLQSDFVIDGDPTSQKIRVVMTIKTGKINVGRAQGSLHGTIVWKLEDTESLRQSIHVNAPAELRLQPISTSLTAYDLSVQKTMDSIMAGYWSVPADFVLHPPMVGVVQ